MIYLSAGSQRQVWRIGDWVLKVTYRPWGANLAEAHVWNTYKDTPEARLFAEIMCYDPAGDWLIQRYCVPLEKSESSPEIDEAKAALTALGVRDVIGSNLGYHPDGRVVAIDYNLHADNQMQPPGLAARKKHSIEHISFR